MMYQGLLGAFPFTVSEFEVCTFRDLKVTREQVYAEHKTLAGLPKLQHTGRNLDPLSLAVRIVPLTAVSTVGLRLCALASGRADPIGNGSYRIRVERIAVFAHDKFNFAESGEIHGDRLGAWNCEKRSFQRSADVDHIALDNSVFRAFRERYGMGNDFLVLSQPHTVETFPGATYVYP